MSTDCETIMDGLSTNISMLVRGVVSIIVSIIFLFVISWELTVTLVGSIIPLLIFAIFYGKRVKKLGKIITDKQAMCNTIAEESFTHIRTVKAFSTEDHETDKYMEGMKDVYKYGVKKCQTDSVFILFLTFMIWTIFVIVIMLSAHLYTSEKIRIGDISAFLLMAM